MHLKTAPCIFFRIISAILLSSAMLNAQAQVEWQKYPFNPVLVRGNQGSWNETGILGPSVTVLKL